MTHVFLQRNFVMFIPCEGHWRFQRALDEAVCYLNVNRQLIDQLLQFGRGVVMFCANC